jgi:hypothetical protein
MTGLLFLTAVAAWLGASLWVAGLAGQKLARPRWRNTVNALVFLVLILSPFVDEVIGKFQFENLCRANGIESADVSKAKGKKVKIDYAGTRALSGTILPIKEQDVHFRDADTGEVLIQHRNYQAQGGWLMRYTWFNMGSNHPMLFGGSTCNVRKEQEVFRTNSITFLYK